MNNDTLHAEAVKLLIVRQRADGNCKDYNLRRREATAALRPILKQIWDKLEAGESVGSYTSKESWAASQSIKIRQIQSIIAGPQKKAQSLRVVSLKEGMTVRIGKRTFVISETPEESHITESQGVITVKGEEIHCSVTLDLGIEYRPAPKVKVPFKEIVVHVQSTKDYHFTMCGRKGIVDFANETRPATCKQCLKRVPVNAEEREMRAFAEAHGGKNLKYYEGLVGVEPKAKLLCLPCGRNTFTTQAGLDAHLKAYHTPRKARTKKPKKVACKLCGVDLPAALLKAKPYAKICSPCKEAGGDVRTYKGQQVTEGKSLYSVQVLPLGVEPQHGSLLRNQ